MSRAVLFATHGGPEVLQVADVDVPPARAGEVRVRHHAIGVNFLDTYHRTGLYPVALPSGLGVEAAGIVESVGEGVEGFAVGDRVAYVHGAPGAYADLRCVPASALVQVPAAVSLEVAGSAMVKGMTAEYLLCRTFAVLSGHSVLIQAAAGGMGQLLSAWARHLGAEVIGTVGSEAKAEVARASGCHHVINYATEDFVARVRELTGGVGVHVVYDGVGQSTFEGSLDCLRRRGMMVSYGQASGKIPPFEVGGLARRGSLFLTRPSLFDYIAVPADRLASAAAVFAMIEAGVLDLAPTTRLPLAEAAEAHRRLESRATSGSTILLAAAAEPLGG